jgi:hypothetical protein
MFRIINQNQTNQPNQKRFVMTELRSKSDRECGFTMVRDLENDGKNWLRNQVFDW